MNKMKNNNQTKIAIFKMIKAHKMPKIFTKISIKSKNKNEFKMLNIYN